MDDLRQLVQQLAEARCQYEQDREVIDKLEADFKLDHEDLLQAMAQTKTIRDDIEGEIRARQYSGADKAPAPGLTVRMISTVSYTPSTALGWAVENQHHNLLTLNAKAFEQVAKGLRLDFVIIGAVPQVTIARDLAPAAAQISAEMAAEGAPNLPASDSGGLLYEESGAERAAEAARETAAPKDIGTAIEELVEGVAAMIEADTAVELLRAAGLGPCTEALVRIQDVIGFFDKAVEVVAP